MPAWMTRFFNFISDLPGRASPKWPWPLRKVRKADISNTERDLFERSGETVISMQVSGSFTGDPDHGKAWLTERADYHERRESITRSVEIAVALLILGEILLALWQGHLQSINFKEQQEVLTNLQTSSAATAKTLTSLQSAIESTNAILQMQLDASRKSEVQAERSAKAAEASASVAALSLHTSERAYIDVDAGLTSSPKVGERLAFRAYFTNVGRTPAPGRGY